MTKKELEQWHKTDVSLEELMNTEIKYYRGFYGDGRAFAMHCKEIDEYYDVIGEGYVNYEKEDNAIFFRTEDVVQEISYEKYKELSKNPFDRLGFSRFAGDWELAEEGLTNGHFILRHTEFRDLMIDVSPSETRSFYSTIVYKGEDDLYIDKIFLSVTVEDQYHLMSILDVIDIESQM